ncbi:MAG: hypothetical protein H6852_11600 [Geminicoccaceae bacterium]|jgi:hypothetical protein|nr:hypothetical protein [Geminicoccaceae bacterium]
MRRRSAIVVVGPVKITAIYRHVVAISSVEREFAGSQCPTRPVMAGADATAGMQALGGTTPGAFSR